MKKDRLPRTLAISMMATCLAASVHAEPAASLGTNSAASENSPFLKLNGTSLTIGKLPPVSFHGFLSQGFLYSSDYNYLGNSTDGSLKFTEVGLSASMNPFPRTRIAVQGFAFAVGEDVGKYHPLLDYASVEYTFNDYLGIRAGRVRRPQGIYNHIQDVDLARTSVLLPQGLHDARFRDFYATIDGGALFGSIPLRKAGSLSYEAYGGMSSPTIDGGAANYVRNQLLPPGVSLDSIDSITQGGVQLWWNTPLDGLRVGGSGLYMPGVTINLAAGPNRFTSVFDLEIYQGSVEYLWKAWTFQAEYMMRFQAPESGAAFRTDAWYVSAAYRFNQWFETGAYYTEYYDDVKQRGDALQYQKDVALSLRFDLKDWWIVKVEGHYLHGTGLLQNDAANPVQNDKGWFMLAVKTTFSF